MVPFLLLSALVATTATAGDKEQFLIHTRSGATLEWKREADGPAELRIKGLKKKSPALEAGYKKKDKIVAIDGEPIGASTLRAYLLHSRTAKSFTVRRKQAELQLPALFQADTVIVSETRPKAKLAEQAPPIKVKLSKEEINLLDRALGSVVLVNFWATWCKPCIEEMPFLNGLQERYRSQGLVILCVNLDDDQSALKTYLEKNPLELLLVRTRGFGSQAPVAYGVDSLPANVLIDREGYVVYASTGSSETYVDEVLAPKVEALLDAEKPPLTITAK